MNVRYFLNILFLITLFGRIVGSEKNERVCHLQENYIEEVAKPFDLLCIKETHFYAKPTLMYSFLCYSDKKYIDFLNQTYGIKCDENEPFIRIEYPGTYKDQQVLKEKIIDPITLVPLKYFIVGNEIRKKDNAFKRQYATLLSFSVQGEDKPVRIRLHEDFVVPLSKAIGDECLKELLERFKKKPLFPWVSYKKTEKLKKELLDAGILMETEGDLTHGPKSFFGEEIKTALFYSRLKKLLCCGSIAAAIFMYILYQKFYATAR